MVQVQVEVGSGLWRRTKTLYLAACPRIGEHVVVDGMAFLVDTVMVDAQQVIVRSPKNVSLEFANNLTILGWEE